MPLKHLVLTLLAVCDIHLIAVKQIYSTIYKVMRFNLIVMMITNSTEKHFQL